MSDFLTRLYEEEMEKVSAADLDAFMDSLSVDELAAICGIDKLAVGGPAEPEMPTGKGHETTDKSKEKGQRDPAADVKAEEEKKAYVVKVAWETPAAVAGGAGALGAGYLALRKGRAGKALEALRGLVGKGGKKATEVAKATKPARASTRPAVTGAAAPKPAVKRKMRSAAARIGRPHGEGRGALRKRRAKPSGAQPSPEKVTQQAEQTQRLADLRKKVLFGEAGWTRKQSSVNLRIFLEKVAAMKAAMSKCDAFTSPEAKAKAKVVRRAMSATKGSPTKVRKAAVSYAAKQMKKASVHFIQ